MTLYSSRFSLYGRLKDAKIHLKDNNKINRK